MTEKQRSAKKREATASAEREKNARSSEEVDVWAALEQARQNVKPIVKKERQAEVATAELLNLRLKAI